MIVKHRTQHLLYFPNHIQQLLMDNFYYFKTERKTQTLGTSIHLHVHTYLFYAVCSWIIVPFIWCDWIHQNVTVDVYRVSLWEDGVLVLETYKHISNTFCSMLTQISYTSHLFHRRKKRKQQKIYDVWRCPHLTGCVHQLQWILLSIHCDHLSERWWETHQTHTHGENTLTPSLSILHTHLWEFLMNFRAEGFRLHARNKIH